MPRRFYFAWVDKDETTFGPAHYREDEEVFSFALTHAEGSFASVDIEILNPKVGLLKTGRERYVWLSCVTDAGVTTPICFGRLVGIPKDLTKESCTITLVCRPPDYTTQKHDLVSELKVLPFYDRLFIPYELRDDLDHVLEARSALWHVDRVTGELTISDIAIGEDATITLGPDKLFYDDLSVSYGQAPLNKVIVRARVEWAQAGTGTINITKQIYDAFAAGQVAAPVLDITRTQIVYNVAATTRRTLCSIPQGLPLLMGASGMVSAWPKTGTNMGGGWQVGASTLQYVGTQPNGDILIGPAGIEDISEADASGIFSGAGIQVQIIKAPDTWNFTTSVIETYPDGSYNEGTSGSYQEGTTTIIWIPITPVAPYMDVYYEANRARSETFEATLVADTQELTHDFTLGSAEADESFLIVDAGSAKADEAKDPPYGSDTETGPNNTAPIVNPRRASYFQTDRGLQSVEYLMLLARANVIARSRAVEVSAAMAFDEGLALSCRKNAIINDYRLPGGTAAGKIMSYTLSYDGSSGTGQSTLVVGCMIGKGGSPVSPVSGTNTYAEDGYGIEYELTYGDTASLATFDSTWSKHLITNQLLDDDGLNLLGLDAYGAVKSCAVSGGLDVQSSSASDSVSYQKDFLNGGAIVATYSSAQDVATKISGITTTMTLNLTNLVDKVFNTAFNLGTVTIKIPKGIDLEA